MAPASSNPSLQSRVAGRIAELFGEEVDWRRETGVVHVTAIGARPRATLAVGPEAPRSPTDRFVLGFARARADALVTTAAILRAEPDLVHRTADEPGEEAAWSDWRAEMLGRSAPPLLLVLTASGDFDLAHPALRAAPQTVVWTTEVGRDRLSRVGGRVGGHVADRVEIVVDSDRSGAGDRRPTASPSAALSAALSGLRRRAGIETIVVEAGPQSTAGLYASAATVEVDELLLGIYAGGRFPAVDGPLFPSTEQLARCFGAGDARTRVRVEEASGPWVFERHRR